MAGAARKPAAAKAAEPEITGDKGVPTVWLDNHGGEPWHVEVGSEAYIRLIGEGAREVPAPKNAAPAGDTQKPGSSKTKLVSDMDHDELLAVADLHELGIDRTLPDDELMAAINQALQDKGFSSEIPVDQLTKGD